MNIEGLLVEKHLPQVIGIDLASVDDGNFAKPLAEAIRFARASGIQAQLLINCYTGQDDTADQFEKLLERVLKALTVDGEKLNHEVVVIGNNYFKITITSLKNDE